MLSFSSQTSLHNIPVHIPCLLAEVHLYFHRAFPVQRIRNQIVLFVYLSQSILNTSVLFKIKDINGILGLHHSICTTTSAACEAPCFESAKGLFVLQCGKGV